MTRFLLALAGTVLLSSSLAGQAAAQSSAPSSAQAPSLQAQIEQHEQKLAEARAAKKQADEALELLFLGHLHWQAGEMQTALDFDNQALPLWQALGDRISEEVTLTNIGKVYDDLGQKDKALDFYNQALTIQRDVNERNGEETTLNYIGAIYSGLGQKQKALDYFNQALPVEREIGDRGDEAATLRNIGHVYYEIGEWQKALDTYNQALPIFQEVGGLGDEINLLNGIGLVYNDLGEQQKALDSYNQALPIEHEIGDRRDEATTLNNIGLVYNDLGEQQEALKYDNQALPIFREVGNRGGEAATLNNIGAVYDGLGEQQEALKYDSQALAIFREVGNRAGEATALSNIGGVYGDLGEKQKALDYYNQALPIERELGDRDGQGTTLNNIGGVYNTLGEKQKALDYYNQALTLRQQVGDRGGVAGSLNNIAGIYEDLGEKPKALEYYNQALPVAAAVNDPLLEAVVFSNLMINQRIAQPALAIFYGKQAVNLLQQVRGNIQGLDKELQSSFLASKDDYYRDLADLLIAQGRLPEAQQVLDLLKQQEYSDYVRGDPTKPLSPLTLTPAERQAQQDYQSSTAQLVSLGEQWAQLRKTAARTPDQEQQFQQLSQQLDTASKGLNDYYSRLYVLFGRSSDANRQLADVQGDVSSLKQQIARMPNTVALYTLVAKDRYRIIVITGAATGSTVVAREFPIAEKDLNEKIAKFSETLRDPRQDPRPQAQELYNILIGPVKADLDQAQAHTLVWSLDGALRYIPMAALYDGKQYLVENYNTVSITSAGIHNLQEKPDVSNLSAIAMGISRKYEDELPGLPTVVGELEDIVKDPQVQEAHGVLPGTILLNGQFTEKAMEDQLASPRAVVHIASHFVFMPGDDTKSYLLLAGKEEGGAGYHLTVADFRDDQNLSLADTELLTLSACETGMGGNAGNGREVDGLGTTAQLKGAKSVLSSLWEVNDSSTGALMADFYQRWAAGEGKVAKVEALRQAQLDLLQERIKPKPDYANPDAPTSFAHPYYWAPFILMGNWQ